MGYAVAGFPAIENGKLVLTRLQTRLEDVAKNGVPADLVDAAKRHELINAELQKNSISDLAMLWSEALAVEERQSPGEDIEAIQRVTVTDVRDIARRLLNQRESISAILKPQQSEQPISSASFGGAESFPATENAAVRLPQWAEKLNQLSIPVSTLHPMSTTLPNGLKLIVQPETVSDTISVFGSIRNSSDPESSPEQESASRVLDELLSYGTEKLDRVEFQKALDEIGANESAGTDFSLEVLARDFDRGVALLADNELHPSLPAGAFKIVRRQVADSLAGELASPVYLTQCALESALLAKNHHDQWRAKSGNIASLSLASVRKYYRRAFRPDMTTIIVIGNITPERAYSVIEQNFGRWKTRGPTPSIHLPPLPINKPSSTQVPDSSRVQAEVTLAETLPVRRSNLDYYSLNLGMHVLDGSFYASRLSRDLRENTGLVYSVSSALDADATGALYSITFGCDPRKVSAARAIVERDLKEMQSSAVPEETLNRAKVLLLQQIPLSESSIRSIADGLIARIENELPLNEPSLAAREYVNLTAQQVHIAFRKWIRPRDLVQVTEGPTPN
jgi:zinc protease